LDLDLKTFRLNQLGIPQDRIAKRLGINRRTLADHLATMPTLANPPNNDLRVTSGLSKGFTVPQVAQKHGWPADKEESGRNILVVDYYEILKRTGWTLSHIIQAPLSSERFNAGVVAAMQQKRSLGLSAGM
jgi:hypothetical protein